MMLLESFVATVVATVGQTNCGGQERQPGVFEQGEVVRFAFYKGGAKQPLVTFPHDDLHLVSVPLLFAAVETPLVFWGAVWALRWHRPPPLAPPTPLPTRLFCLKAALWSHRKSRDVGSNRVL